MKARKSHNDSQQLMKEIVSFKHLLQLQNRHNIQHIISKPGSKKRWILLLFNYAFLLLFFPKDDRVILFTWSSLKPVCRRLPFLYSVYGSTNQREKFTVMVFQGVHPKKNMDTHIGVSRTQLYFVFTLCGETIYGIDQTKKVFFVQKDKINKKDSL